MHLYLMYLRMQNYQSCQYLKNKCEKPKTNVTAVAELLQPDK